MMPLNHLIYISISNIPEEHREGAIAEILGAARRRNQLLRLSGAMVFTGSRFAQYLEGPSAALNAVAEYIRQDSRHRDFQVISDGQIAVRRFSGWSMAYAGPSHFVERTLAGTLVEDGRARSIARLLTLMQDFAVVADPADHN